MDRYQEVIHKLERVNEIKARISIIDSEIKKIDLNETYGLRAITYDGIKTSPTHKVSQPTCEIAVSIVSKKEPLQAEKEIFKLELQQIEEALKTLSPDQKEIIEQKYINNDKITCKEIMKKLKIDKNKYYNIYREGMEAVSKLLML